MPHSVSKSLPLLAKKEARALPDAAEAFMTRAERVQARAELAREIQDALKRLSAASPIGPT